MFNEMMALGSGGSGGGSAKCILNVDSGTAKSIDTDYVTFSSNTATFVKPCKGLLTYYRIDSATIGGTATRTPVGSNSGVYEFEATAGQTITYSASVSYYGWTLTLVE